MKYINYGEQNIRLKNFRYVYLFSINKSNIRISILSLEISLAVILVGTFALYSQIIEISFASQSDTAYPIPTSLDTNGLAQILNNSLARGNFNLTGNNLVKGQNIALQGIISSGQDPFPGHEGHHVAMILPVAGDNLVYSGIITFTATEPVQLQVNHIYETDNATRISEQFGQILNSTSNDRIQVISLITPHYGPAPLYSASVPFTGNEVALHTLTGKPFIAPYTVHVKINKALSLNNLGNNGTSKLATIPTQDQILEPQQAPTSYVTVPNLLVEALTILSPDVIAELPLDRLPQNDLLKLFNSPPEKVTKILNKLPPDRRAEILDKLPPDRRAEILDKISPT